ncbi:MAG: hypothetical protein K8F52_05830 [Candidatus Scalindua rubra]|uniref:ATP-grasp domain-containing protein n=1 Tax=Candidatus Scalindua brodae TaxID=237368 RepID=A0A0B0EE16_9BACT|nr:MAG: hypothetical protein SCABRO_02900 [Candidatus Scalindua brodae]MBZ0108168.1 hypothetical protein [Candidatus Scalindua rubra]TWU34671.1 carbamoyl phosphate synthase-like protein [Candidatus Brocadiaceae bacterium S225]
MVKNKILILENCRQTLVVLRSLVNAGYDTVIGYHDEIRDKFVLSSRYTKETWLHPALNEEEKFIEALTAFLKRRGDIKYIFPVDNAIISLLTRNFDQISSICGILMASPFATEICLDKAKTYDLAHEQNIPLPETSTVRSFTDINTQIGKIGFPFILKPRTSGKSLYGKKCIISHTPDEFKNHFPKWPENHSDLLLQKKVLGFRYNCNFTAINGKIVGYFEAKTLRTEDYDYTGSAVNTVSVRPSNKRKHYCELLTHKLDYTGIGIIQFLVDEEDGTPYFLEFNPRMGGSHALPYYCGVDFPKQAIDVHQYLSGEIASLPQYSKDYRLGIRIHWLFGDITGMLKERRKKEISILQGIGWMFRIIISIFRASHHMTWSWKDPLPTLVLYKQEFLNIVLRRIGFR